MRFVVSQYKPFFLAGVACVCFACGGVGDSDPAFWTPGQDLGGSLPGQGGEGGVPNNGAGGFVGAGSVVGAGSFVGAGGSVIGAGGSVVIGAGGQVIIGAGGYVSAGGYVGAGGFTSAGGNVNVGGSTQPPPPPPPPPPGGPCSFTFNVTTQSYGGRYAPNNVGAIWITNSSGQFVKTLMAWGTIRLGNASAWEASSAGNTVDAVTSATRRNHGPLTANWNCSDVNGAFVPDGTYNVSVTFAEDNSIPFFGPAPHVAVVGFAKTAFPLTPSPDQPNFVQMSLSLQ